MLWTVSSSIGVVIEHIGHVIPNSSGVPFFSGSYARLFVEQIRQRSCPHFKVIKFYGIALQLEQTL